MKEIDLPSFQVLYEGRSLDSHMMDVRILAPVLGGFGDLIDETNHLVTGGKLPMALNVKADFRAGSFGVDFVLAHAQDIGHAHAQFVDFFSNRTVLAWAACFSLVGINGKGLLQLLKAAKGRRPRRVLEVQQTTRVRLEFDGDAVEVDRNVHKLFTNSRARKAVEALAKPLLEVGVDALKVIHKGKQFFGASRDEAESFLAPENPDDCNVVETDRTLQIVALSFVPGNKWRVTDGATQYFVSIADQDFCRLVESGRIPFRKNDLLQVRLRTRQWYDGDELKAAHEVIKVHKHQHAPSQLEFPDQEGG